MHNKLGAITTSRILIFKTLGINRMALFLANDVNWFNIYFLVLYENYGLQKPPIF